MRFTVSVDLSSLGDLTAAIEAAADQALHDLATEAGKKWARAIYDAAGLDGGTRYDYAKTLHVDRTGWLNYTVTADYPKAGRIEEGTPGRDLKRMLQTSNKARQGKKGRYLIIPFRHNTPGQTAHARAMPPDIYARLTQKDAAGRDTFQVSRVLNTGTRISATGQTVPQAKYQWGGRLPAGLAPLAPHHRSDPFAGLVRMDTSTSKSRSSAYLTFRCMSESQHGKWLIPARTGLHIVRDVTAEIQRMAPGFVQQRIDELLRS
jgi:hypothetical protein